MSFYESKFIDGVELSYQLNYENKSFQNEQLFEDLFQYIKPNENFEDIEINEIDDILSNSESSLNISDMHFFKQQMEQNALSPLSNNSSDYSYDPSFSETSGNSNAENIVYLSQNANVLENPSFISDFKIEVIENEINFDNRILKIKDEQISRKRELKKKPENMKDCLHIWQFLRDLLKDDHYNDAIEWLDQKNGIFKIKNPTKVSGLWGKIKSGKDGMKYANMARGIRYSREEGGYFDLVSKNYGHGKKLVYKFSQKSKKHCEWLNSIMS